MAQSIGWELYRSLLGVLQQGSLSGAARELGLTQPTVGRHIATLEQQLGVLLFTRSQLGLLPTDAALALRGHAEAMASSAAALARLATSQGDAAKGLNGTVRITASEVVGVEVLPPIVKALRDQQPGITIELQLSNRVQDLLQREADIAVRMVRPTQNQLVARQIGQIELGLFAHPAYLAAHGTPRSLQDMAGHAFIGFDELTPYLRAVAQRLGVQREMFTLRSDSDLAQLALIRAAAGIGFCQVALAQRSEPPLQRLLASEFSLQLDTWITMHEDLRHSAACRVVFDGLAEGLQQHVAAAGSA
ncbi:MAG TPA: LysR family transcriptional regulator [Ideonella sp.]|uniref:LysR family transcriptional regulator n=1 Tax=Ideonella sp. TaxID=1929293 RepID=UPI002CFBFE35|nr:LysR family transcriptional regulator [Ideonella sp.]HSI51796.1 LysR family transcriptional regulator [Ideonella sp.]